MSALPDSADPVSERPSWDASQVNLRAWLEDLFPWLQTRNQSYAPLIEKGYVNTTQGRVVVPGRPQAARPLAARPPGLDRAARRLLN
eukprot:476800-Pleurochrysis_carterae.AAC.1